MGIAAEAVRMRKSRAGQRHFHRAELGLGPHPPAPLPAGEGDSRGGKDHSQALPGVILVAVNHHPAGKKTPLCSRPIWANTLLEVDAESETNSKLWAGTDAVNSITALVMTNRPAKSCAAFRTVTRFTTPLHRAFKEAVAGTEGPCRMSSQKVPKSKSWILASLSDAWPSPRLISTLSGGMGIVQNKPPGTFPGSMLVTWDSRLLSV